MKETVHRILFDARDLEVEGPRATRTAALLEALAHELDDNEELHVLLPSHAGINFGDKSDQVRLHPCAHSSNKLTSFIREFLTVLKVKPDVIHDSAGIRRRLFRRRRKFLFHAVDTRMFSSVSPILLDDFKARHHLPEKFILTFVPDNVSRNIETVVNAVMLMDSSEVLPVVIVGIDRHDAICKTIEKRGLDDGFFILKSIPEAERPLLLAAATVLLKSDIQDTDFFDVLESMACRTPVIMAAMPNAITVFRNIAKLVHPTDPKEWVSAIRSAEISIDWHDLAADRGLKLASEYTWQNAARKYMEIYRWHYRRRHNFLHR